MRISFLVFLSLNTSVWSFAAEIPALSFYRNQQSLFPSGQASREDLEEKVLRRDYELWLRVSWNKKTYEIPGETVIRDVQVTKNLISKESLDLLKDPQETSSRITTVSANTTLQVLHTNSYWAELLETKTKLRGWAPLHLLEAPAEDQGVFITLIDTFLRKTPQDSSGIITTVPRLQRLTPLGIEKSYLKVSYQGHIGYLDLANLTGRADFAMWAYHQNKGWLGISHRENEYLFTVDNQKIPLQGFLAFNPYVSRGVVCQKLKEEAPSIRSRVEIANNKAHRWTLSLLEGHGSVWWRMDEPTISYKPLAENQITSEQLLKREVSAVAFAAKSIKGLVSANGIFRTEDGKIWKEIALFEGKNFPVAIHPDGIWYVGNYRSFDEGKSFETYIKWDKLAEQIQFSLHKTPRHLRITQIDPISHSRLQILIDTGTQKIKMRAHILSHEWTLVK
ncbi:MAG TPA: hypothetical protein VIG33_15365 [Pseudobdellovibrionaceae bacterium]|jgi:hypothetical protein